MWIEDSTTICPLGSENSQKSVEWKMLVSEWSGQQSSSDLLSGCLWNASIIIRPWNHNLQISLYHMTEWDWRFMCQQHDKAQRNYWKNSLQKQCWNRFWENHCKGMCHCNEKMARHKLNGYQAHLDYFQPFYFLTVSLFIVYVAMCHCCGLLVLA